MRARHRRSMLRVDESPLGGPSHVPPSADRRTPDPCSRRGVRRASRQSEPRGLGHAHGQPPVADGVALAIATAAPTPSPTPSPTLTPATPSPTIAPPTPTPTPTTMIVRAYFLMRDGSGGEVVNEPTLVPVLRTVPRSTATATAAMKALLAGPSAKERAPTVADQDAHPRRHEAPRDRDLGRPRDGRPVRRVRLAIP